jgi:hypothetical protein
MKKIYIVIILLVAAAALYLFLGKGNKPAIFSTPSPTPKIIDYIATFEITTNGTKRDFSDRKYHNLTDYVYLSALDPNFVHVKKTGVTWQEFFDTLPMKLTSECLTTGTGQVFCTNSTKKLKFTLDNKDEPNALSMEIKPGAKLQISYE